MSPRHPHRWHFFEILACPARFERATYALEGRNFKNRNSLLLAVSCPSDHNLSASPLKMCNICLHTFLISQALLKVTLKRLNLTISINNSFFVSFRSSLGSQVMRVDNMGDRLLNQAKQPLLYVTVVLLLTFLPRHFLMPVQLCCNKLPAIVY